MVVPGGKLGGWVGRCPCSLAKVGGLRVKGGL